MANLSFNPGGMLMKRSAKPQTSTPAGPVTGPGPTSAGWGGSDSSGHFDQRSNPGIKPPMPVGITPGMGAEPFNKPRPLGNTALAEPLGGLGGGGSMGFDPGPGMPMPGPQTPGQDMGPDQWQAMQQMFGGAARPPMGGTPAPQLAPQQFPGQSLASRFNPRPVGPGVR